MLADLSVLGLLSNSLPDCKKKKEEKMGPYTLTCIHVRSRSFNPNTRTVSVEHKIFDLLQDDRRCIVCIVYSIHIT